MALVQTIDSSDLYHLACRMDRGDQFGYKGWGLIGEHLEELSDSIGENIEIDIVGICCEYSKADDADDAYTQLQIDIDQVDWEEMSDDEKLEEIRSYLENETCVVCCKDDLIIWQAF